ncbi:MAG: RiPP maturation radical SAM protein 1, partial [bacterium]|nr:RiPP maturation radical SAM protein 1 [bacterium]
MTDICLALMPYGNLPRPSLALSLLKAYLAETDVRVKVTYPNFLFAQEIGAQLYMALGSRSGAYQVGEWTFARAAFPDFKSDDDEYLAGMDAILPDDGFMTEALAGRSIKDLLPELREKTTTFVNRTAQSILDLKPRIVGCSSTGQQRCASLALLRRIRELDPRVITLMGGANCEGPMGVVTRREFPWVDFVVSGEADGFFTDFCRMLLEYGRDVPIDELPYGVIGPHFFFGNDPRPAPRATFHDMNTQPFPDFDDYFQALHKSGFDLDPELIVETSRGCWWGEKSHCTFCGLNGTVIKFRSKSPERVLDELKFLSERYRMRSFDVVDCIVDLGYVKTLFPKLADLGGPYSIFYETKGNLTREHLELF